MPVVQNGPARTTCSKLYFYIMGLFEKILSARGLVGDKREAFLHPSYAAGHDPFRLPDMDKAVNRLVLARERQERIVIYGDYDIDGLTATTVLLDSLAKFGYRQVETYIPNRFIEGYGLTVDAVDRIANNGADLIITVDCGSLSTKEIEHANSLGIDVIVTDHHNVLAVQPPAVAVVNPKRHLMEKPKLYHNYSLKNPEKYPRLYPFVDLPGVGVAFKLVQALQTRLDGLPAGHEKWLLDLVGLGTVCDVVNLQDENRMHVYFGLQVAKKTRRPGLKALMAVAGVEIEKLNARSFGFQLGPRMNAAGRLETALYSLEMLRATDGMRALDKAQQLDAMNMERRKEQDRIFKEAILLAEQYIKDPVLVVSAPNWSHGIIGIVAAKLLEKYKKPTFVLEEIGQEAKGSARSFGDFSAADAIRAADDLIIKGGGHKLAAGVTLMTKNIAAFRKRLNEHYVSLALTNQAASLLPQADVTLVDLAELNEELVNNIQLLEPFGTGNPEPILKLDNALVVNARRMGADGQHVKLTVQDKVNNQVALLAFSAPEEFFVDIGERVDVWFALGINEWNGYKAVEGRLLRLQNVA